MKELKIELNKSGRLKNKYDNFIKIGRTPKGCFILTETIKCGPFERIFIDHSENGDELIIGYTPSKTEFYRINPKGINLDKQVCISIKDLANLKEKNISFENCELLGNVNGHAIFFDINEGFYFAVNTLKEIKSLSEYKKFDSYEDLTSYYKDKNIELYSTGIQSLANKHKKTLINFNNLYEYIEELTVSDLTEEILFDIVTGRNSLKKIYNLAKPHFVKEIKTASKYSELTSIGYEEIKSIGYETISKNRMEEMSKYDSLTTSKITRIKEECIKVIKERDPLDFNKLSYYLRKVTISEISHDVQKELSAKRPLTRQIFSGIITAGLDKIRLEGIDISEYYYSLTNISSIYPVEVEQLRNIALEIIPNLYNQYFEEKTKKRII